MMMMICKSFDSSYRKEAKFSGSLHILGVARPSLSVPWMFLAGWSQSNPSPAPKPEGSRSPAREWML